jgi:hypothetical protein
MKPLKTRVFQTVKEIQLKGIQKCFIAFSQPGKLFGIFNEKTKVITIYDSSDIKKCIKNIETGEYLYRFKIIDD